MHRIPGQDPSTAPHVVACRVESLLDEQARVVDELMSAETTYIEAVAAARQAGLLRRSDLTEAYARLEGWGISNFAHRWRRLVGIDPRQLHPVPVSALPGIDPAPGARAAPGDPCHTRS